MPRSKEFDQEQVVSKAMEVFWSRGYEATSTRDLVELIGISHGSLYNAFGDKYSLYLSALDYYINNYLSQLEVKLAQPGSVKENLTAMLQSLTSQACAQVSKNGCFLANTAIELAPHDPQVALRVENSNTRSEQALYQALLRAKQAGEICSGQNLLSLARMLNNTISGIRVRSKSNPPAQVLEDIMSTTLSLIFK
jgi:TetR/AcrR family transcriptional repressor of nem operon